MISKKYSQQKVDQAGFDYYLDRLEEKRKEARSSVQLDLLLLLASEEGEMQLFKMASLALGDNVSGDQMMGFFETIKKMKASYLIKILGTEGKSGTSVKNLKVKLTEMGKKTLEADIGLSIKVESE